MLFVSKNVDSDNDNDGVNDDADVCPGTVIPEMTQDELANRRYALTNDGFVFSTKGGTRGDSRPVFTTEDTAGCSCTQIRAANEADPDSDNGKYLKKRGCGVRVMNRWVRAQL